MWLREPKPVLCDNPEGWGGWEGRGRLRREGTEAYLWLIHVMCGRNQENAAAKSLQSCPTLCDPIDGSPPGPAIPGILQARTLEWVAISFSRA